MFRRTPTQPVVSDRLWGSYPVVWIDLKTATQEVDELGVTSRLGGAGVDESSHEVPGKRRAAKPPALGVAAGDDGDAFLVDRLDTVARNSAAGDEVALALTRRNELLTRQAEHLDYTRHLVVLVFAGKQWVPGQQLDHDAACT